MSMVAVPIELLWSFIGLILTIGGTFLEASITNAPWDWSHSGVHPHALGVTYQLGAVLLAGCMGGRNAGALSQIAYLSLGLVGFPVFTYGGGLGYFQEATFGYLLGFLPAAWICGYLAFLAPPRLESLWFCGLCGLVTIHLTGITYLCLGYLFRWVGDMSPPLLQMLAKYSLYPLPGQFAIVCAVAVVAYAMRRLMFY